MDPPVPNAAAKSLAFLVRIPEVPDLGPAILTESFVTFLDKSSKMTGQNRQLGHDHLLPHIFN
jgi:hypothetical protein